MSSLTGSSISGTYDQLLALPSGGGSAGSPTTLLPITDGNEDVLFALQISSAGVHSTGTMSAASWTGILDITDTTDASTNDGDSGALRCAGGVSIAKKLYVGTNLDVNGTSQFDGALTVGVDDTGHDVTFYGNTASHSCIWDTSADSLVLAPTVKLGFDGVGGHTYIEESSADILDVYVGGNNLLKFSELGGSGNDRVQVPTNVKFLIGNADTYFIENPDDTLQLTVGSQAMMLWDQDHQDTVGGMGIISCGTDGLGLDFKVYGDTSNQYMLWDQSEDSLKVAGSFAASGPSATFVTFADGDATPSVSSGNLFKHHASAQAITMFDDGVIGQIITVISTAAITYDVTSTNLKGGSTDLVTANGESTVWVFDGTNWYLIGYMDLSQNYNVDGV